MLVERGMSREAQVCSVGACVCVGASFALLNIPDVSIGRYYLVLPRESHLAGQVVDGRGSGRAHGQWHW